MIEKIFIPTVNRVDNQTTYEQLSDDLKSRVVFVVQKWEREQYDYDAEYLVLPEWLTTEHPRPVSHTRQIIYEAGVDMKYAMLDDDLIFHRRNAKYWTNESNMEMSKRKCTPEDVQDMFDMYSLWLDEDTVSMTGCGHIEHPPSNNEFKLNSSISSCMWLNGSDFKADLPNMKLTDTRVAQDVVFILSMLTRGYGNKISNEFVFQNQSVHKASMKSDIWDNIQIEKVHEDHKTIEKMFPNFFKILYDDEGERVSGGFRQAGKTQVKWSKAYTFSEQHNLSDFF
jgi:hypothetical protein